MFVIDTSIILRLFTENGQKDSAQKAIAYLYEKKIPLYAPDLLFREVINILCSQQFSENEVNIALDFLDNLISEKFLNIIPTSHNTRAKTVEMATQTIKKQGLYIKFRCNFSYSCNRFRMPILYSRQKTLQQNKRQIWKYNPT